MEQKAQTNVAVAPKPWVKLHLEPQSERSNMPDFIIGLLQESTPANYVLSNVIEEGEHGEPIERRDFDFVNRTYVWRCEMIGAQKPFVASEDDEGGLG